MGRIIRAAQRFIANNLAPNRVLLYLTTLADIAVALLAVSNDLDVEQVSIVITAVIAVNAKVLAWIKGHQEMLEALYQRDLIAYQANVQADLNAQRLDAAKQVSAPGSGRKVQLPR